MKRFQSLLWLFSGIFIGFLCAALITTAHSDQPAVNYSQPVARVGETVITRQELAEQAILTAGRRLINGDLQTKALVVEAARRAGVTVTTEEVNREVNMMLSFARDVGAPVRLRDMPRFILEDRARTILLATKMMGISITDDEARKYYRQNPSGFVQPAMAKLICIVTGSRTKANEVLKRLQNGEDPKALAELLSSDPGLKQRKGEINWVTRSQLGPEADAAIFDANDGAGLKPGQWTDVIAYKYVDSEYFKDSVLQQGNKVDPAKVMITSYAVFYLEDIRAAYVPKYEEIKDSALYAARMGKYNTEVPKWLAKLASDIGKEWQASTNMLNPDAPLKSAPLDPEYYFKPRQE